MYRHIQNVFAQPRLQNNSQTRNVTKHSEKYSMKRLGYVEFRCMPEIVSENFPYDRHDGEHLSCVCISVSLCPALPTTHLAARS